MSLLSPPLEAFLAIVKHKTVHGASSDLGITQTGVTQRIRLLEGQLATTLFTRSRRGMMLTGEGQALLRYCQAARDLEGEALATIQGAGKSRSVRVGVTGPTSILRSRIIPQCLPVMKQFPELLLSFHISDGEHGLDDLRTGATQCAVVPREHVPREMDSKLLKPERYVLVACRAWKKRTLLDIVKNERIIDFEPGDQMTFGYLKKFKLLDQAKTDRHFVNNTESLAELIEAGFGYGVLAHEFAQRFQERCDLAVLNEERYFENELALAWYPRPEPPRYWRALISAVK